MSLGLIEIADESVTEDEEIYRLYIEGSPAVCLRIKDGDAQLNWAVHGPQYWPKAALLIQGLLELTVLVESKGR